MIRAEGKKRGTELNVEYRNGKFFYNGIEGLYDLEMNSLLDAKHPAGGTYVPSGRYDPLNIINILSNWFFDKPILNIESDEAVELPSGEGEVF